MVASKMKDTRDGGIQHANRAASLRSCLLVVKVTGVFPFTGLAVGKGDGEEFLYERSELFSRKGGHLSGTLRTARSTKGRETVPS